MDSVCQICFYSISCFFLDSYEISCWCADQVVSEGFSMRMSDCCETQKVHKNHVKMLLRHKDGFRGRLFSFKTRHSFTCRSTLCSCCHTNTSCQGRIALTFCWFTWVYLRPQFCLCPKVCFVLIGCLTAVDVEHQKLRLNGFGETICLSGKRTLTHQSWLTGSQPKYGSCVRLLTCILFDTEILWLKKRIWIPMNQLDKGCL